MCILDDDGDDNDDDDDADEDDDADHQVSRSDAWGVARSHAPDVSRSDAYAKKTPLKKSKSLADLKVPVPPWKRENIMASIRPKGVLPTPSSPRSQRAWPWRWGIIFNVFKDIRLNGINGEVVPGDDGCHGAIIGQWAQCLLHKLFIPAMDGATITVDVAVNPSELFEVALIASSMLDDVVPPSILFLFICRGTACDDFTLFNAQRETAELVATELFQHVLESPPCLMLVDTSPWDLKPRPLTKRYTLSFDFVFLDVEMFDNANLFINLWKEKVLTRILDCMTSGRSP